MSAFYIIKKKILTKFYKEQYVENFLGPMIFSVISMKFPGPVIFSVIYPQSFLTVLAYLQLVIVK